jgi:hypothetical protein
MALSFWRTHTHTHKASDTLPLSQLLDFWLSNTMTEIM